tara:strand:- start:470 stop:697 length:228 start_codon:yes stop_codon:yes gene_type:complete
MLFKYISLPVFIISFAIGIFYVYLLTPSPNIIYVYPTPDNINNIEYKDKADICFKFEASEVNCLNTKFKDIPIQS